MDRRSWGLMLLLAAIWGSSYMFIKIGLRDFSPAMVSCTRIALAALILLPFALARGAFDGLRGKVVLVALLGAVQVAGPFLLISAGEEEISSSLAGILVSSTPLFTALLAVWVDHEERSPGLRMAGVLAGFAGVILLLGVDLSGSTAALLGGLAVVLASLGYAIGGFMVKHRLAEADPIGVVAGVMAASALLLAPYAIATAPGSVPDAGPIAAVAALGVAGTGIAFVIFYGLIASVGPAKTMLVSYIAPGFAVVYGATLLDEPITVAIVAGLTLIVGGSWLAAEGRLPRRAAVAPPGESEERELPPVEAALRERV